MRSPVIIVASLVFAMLAATDLRASAAIYGIGSVAPPIGRPDASTTRLPGREDDARVADVAFRLATAGRVRCPRPGVATGLLLHHLAQFELADRSQAVATWHLDSGPGVIVVVPGGPAATAGIRAGDVLLSIGGAALPPAPGADLPFDAATAHARADAIYDLLEAGSAATPLTLLRDGRPYTTSLNAVPACPSRVHLARSDQRNAYADGRHVLLTTGLLKRLQGTDELAFVIAHEMAHNALGHAAVMRAGTVRRGLARTLGRSGTIVRRAEHDADVLAGEMILDAGYDPVAGAAVIARLGGERGGAFAAHASAADRIGTMRALADARRPR